MFGDEPPLLNAVRGGHVEKVNILLSALTLRCSDDVLNCHLQAAIQEVLHCIFAGATPDTAVTIAKALVAAGADVHAKVADPSTCAVAATTCMYIDGTNMLLFERCPRYLLSRVVGLNLPTSTSTPTPTSSAAVSLVQYLLEQGPSREEVADTCTIWTTAHPAYSYIPAYGVQDECKDTLKAFAECVTKTRIACMHLVEGATALPRVLAEIVAHNYIPYVPQ